jgi:cytochrome c551/c552
MKARWITLPAAALMIVSAGQALADEALAKKSGCLECHAIDKSVDKKPIGPAFHDIAAKYRGNASARNALIETLKKGGKGNWTDVSKGAPMPPYSPRLSDAEIRRLVDWVLGL